MEVTELDPSHRQVYQDQRVDILCKGFVDVSQLWDIHTRSNGHKKLGLFVTYERDGITKATTTINMFATKVTIISH